MINRPVRTLNRVARSDNRFGGQEGSLPMPDIDGDGKADDLPQDTLDPSESEQGAVLRRRNESLEVTTPES